MFQPTQGGHLLVFLMPKFNTNFEEDVYIPRRGHVLQTTWIRLSVTIIGQGFNVKTQTWLVKILLMSSFVDFRSVVSEDLNLLSYQCIGPIQFFFPIGPTNKFKIIFSRPVNMHVNSVRTRFRWERLLTLKYDIMYLAIVSCFSNLARNMSLCCNP